MQKSYYNVYYSTKWIMTTKWMICITTYFNYNVTIIIIIAYYIYLINIMDVITY